MPFLFDPTGQNIRAKESPIRLLCIGNSGTGKTGSILGLAKAGFIVHLLDLEHKAESLIRTILRDEVEAKQLTQAQANEVLGRLDIEVVQESMSVTEKEMKLGAPKAYDAAKEVLAKWADAKLDRNHVVVLDSFTRLGYYAAYKVAKQVGHEPEFKDFNLVYRFLKPFLAFLTAWHPLYENTGTQFDCHTIVLTHINLYQVRKATGNKIKAGNASVDETEVIDTIVYPSAIGQALSPEIPQFFNSMLVYRTAVNKPNERVIALQADAMTPVKVPAINFAKATKTLPVENGLATYFKVCGATPNA